MRRRHLFEFEEQPWLPTVLRNLQTDFLRQMSTTLRLYAPVASLLERVLTQLPARRIVDLCSGAAGPWEQLLASGWPVHVTLTDRYPNQGALARIKARHQGCIDYHPAPVDARCLPEHLDGMRTLFNGFHHFRPEEAREILRDAVEHRAAIGIFEIAERTPRTWLAVLIGVPLLIFALTPCLRPLTLARLFWTYGLPLAPLCILWDGLVSLLRAYSQADLLAMAAAAGGDYHWECGRLEQPFPAVPITYLLGYPRGSRSPDTTSAPAFRPDQLQQAAE
jgi:hypothetical protein